MSRKLLSITANFEVSDHDDNPPDLGELMAEIEHRLACLDGVDYASADVGPASGRYSVVVELEGHDPDENAAALEMVEAIKRVVKRLYGEPYATPALILDEVDD